MTKTIVLALLSGSLLLGCGGEGAEQTGESTSAIEIILSTEFINIDRFSYSSYGMMTWVLAKPADAPLYLGSISAQRISGTGIVAGIIMPGTAQKSGRVNLQLSPDIYDSLLSVSTSPGTHRVQLSFEAMTYAPVRISIE
jgi:hypothetical protein